MQADRQKRIAHGVLAGLFVVYTVVGVLFNIIVPLGDAPDEPAHFFYVQYVAQHHALPVMQPHYQDNATVEAFQAPAYYVAAALLTHFTLQGESIQLYYNPAYEFGKPAPLFLPLPEHEFPWRGAVLAWHLVRFFSLALGAVSLWATYRSAWLLFESRWPALAAVAFVGLNPQFIYLHSMVTNDALATTVGSLLTLATLYLLKDGRLRHFFGVALLTTLGFLTKPSALTLYPGVTLALFIAWQRLPRGYQRRMALALCVLIPLTGGGWWVLRNLHLYGDPVGLTVAKQSLAANYYPAPLTLPQLIATLPQMFWQTFQSGWGHFGWLSFPLAPSVFYLIAGLHLPAIAGLLLKCKTASSKRGPAWALAAAWIGLLCGFIYYNLETNSSGWQGRFLFPGLSITALGFVAGWRYWVKKYERLLPALMAGAGGALTLYAVVGIVLPAYVPPHFFSAATATPGSCKATFPGGLELVGCELQPERARAGSRMTLTLYWKMVEPSNVPYLFIVDSYTPHGDMVIFRTESRLARRFPTVLWPANSIVADHYTLNIARGQRQVAAELGLQVLVKDKTVDDGWHAVAGRIGIGEVIVGAGATLPIPRRVQACFGEDKIALTGDAISPTSIHAGETLTVTLHWHALAQPPADYQVFVHLLDDAGQLIAQHDGPPRLGLYPTSAWAAGEDVEDAHPIQLPADYQGVVQPCVGLYVLDSLQRLPVTGMTDGICPERSAPLAPLTVSLP
ncbi:MAG TPA: glycosyltransferase family 39 protein [Anaerolineae bacterium]|nr:glycosyltransferase family 39 protein [Anaerolineae bacterium]HQH39406.1 glycosyltransferase family 39 protein [Anaerolineae bacterium]